MCGPLRHGSTAIHICILKLPTFKYSPETTHGRMEIDSFVLSICLHFSTRLGLLRKVLIHRVYVSSKGRFKITRWLVFGGGIAMTGEATVFLTELIYGKWWRVQNTIPIYSY